MAKTKRSFVEAKNIKEKTYKTGCKVEAEPFVENNVGKGYQHKFKVIKLTIEEIKKIKKGEKIYSEDEDGWEEISLATLNPFPQS